MFGPFRLEPRVRRLTRDGQPIALARRSFELLEQFVARPGETLSKDALIETAWPDVVVTDNSLEKSVSELRKTLAKGGTAPFIETVPRRGYRFVAAVTREAPRESREALDDLLAPHRAWLDGRAALETLERDQILRAVSVFEGVLAKTPDQASVHVGLANACAMQFETTRATVTPDTAALARALHHAREACSLDPSYGEAWATLGFVLARTGLAQAGDALAALRRAVSLERDNWRHHLRLSSVAWGEERLREARRTLTLLPGMPLAHWLAASVHVARQALDEAERELTTAVASEAGRGEDRSRFTGVALHWLLGLLLLARGEGAQALEAFQRELALESSGHLYARECAANTLYAIGAMHLSETRVEEAISAFEAARERVPMHPMATLGLELARGNPTPSPGSIRSFDAELLRAARAVWHGEAGGAAGILEAALLQADPGSAGWLIPIEPLLRVARAPEVWAGVLARLRMRAA